MKYFCWSGDINDQFLAELYSSPARALVLSTDGGDSSVARGAVDVVRGRGMATVALGRVISAGLPIFAAGRTRFVLPSTIFLYHEPYTEYDRPTSLFKDEHRVQSASLATFYAWMGEVMASASTLPAGEWGEMGRGAGTEFAAHRALELGLATGQLADARLETLEAALYGREAPADGPAGEPDAGDDGGDVGEGLE